MTLENVLITGQLAGRPVRPIQSTFMNSVVVDLDRRIAENPSCCLKDLTEAVIELIGAHSSGASLLEQAGSHAAYQWRALAGLWARRAAGAPPQDAGLSKFAVERAALVLLSRPERHFPDLAGSGQPIVEAMLAPFVDSTGTAGTLWAVSHNEVLKFDSQDAFMLEELARMAARSAPRFARH